MTGITASTFSVLIQIYGVTNLNFLIVPYVAIDPEFPHHMNSFDNVPINYTSGELTKFAVQSSSELTHTERIDYHAQTSGRTFRTFPANSDGNYNGNKILMLLTSLFISASFNNGVSYFPVQITVSYNIINATHYDWTTKLYCCAQITRLHYSMIVFNQDDVQSSNQYYLEFFIWTTPTPGGFI